MNIRILRYYSEDKSWGAICPHCAAEMFSNNDPYNYGIYCENCRKISFAAELTGYIDEGMPEKPVCQSPLLKCPYCRQFMPFELGYVQEGNMPCEYCGKVVLICSER